MARRSSYLDLDTAMKLRGIRRHKHNAIAKQSRKINRGK